MHLAMAEYADSFVVEITASRHLDPIELERLLSRLPGVTAVSVTDPYAADAALDPVDRPMPRDYEESE